MFFFDSHLQTKKRKDVLLCQLFTKKVMLTQNRKFIKFDTSLPSFSSFSWPFPRAHVSLKHKSKFIEISKNQKKKYAVIKLCNQIPNYITVFNYNLKQFCNRNFTESFAKEKQSKIYSKKNVLKVSS